ncbi:hypothetical protein [Nocardiopsis metallicus]|uniref:Uncharacterized protein n=1 Tax=Nocardiopsis metallicus TaxID=179819 RepID=A0A840WF58_9ACTN|nr:hypothetical protein [Nocardiopsis metallicus]MBB5494744.1 hypothetical protein [Nocardiopsis metallicus]
MGSSGKTTHATYATAPTIKLAPEEIVVEEEQAAWGEDITELIAPEPHLQQEQPPSEENLAPAPGAAEGEEEEPAGAHELSPDVPETSLVTPDAMASEAALPVPETPPEGVAAGVPVLVGGADLQDSAATLISYHSTDEAGPREVLLTTLNEDAEAKLMDALALSEEKLVPVQVEEEIHGRLPLDQDKQLYELCSKTAVSINHRLKHDQPIPQKTLDYLNNATTAVQEVLDNSDSTQDELVMAGVYKNWLNTMQDRIDKAGTVPYAQGGKVPKIGPYEHSGMVTVTKMVPAPTEESPHGLLTAKLRDASRIKANIDLSTGTTSWDGTSRSPAKGKEYEIDLGDGYTAVYRPHAANSENKSEYSLRGQLEVHAPQGSGHGQDLVKRLGALHLVNRAMSPREAEWTYLTNNIHAQGLGNKPAVKEALAKADQMEELQLQELFHQNAHQAVGLNADGLSSLAKGWQIEAAAACLPKKVRLVREAVATSVGFTNGAELAASTGYDPKPKAAGGWLTWGRFDLGNDKEVLNKAWEGKSLAHSVTGGNLANILATGVLASTERRATMGISTGLGMSEQQDKFTGGAGSVFMRVRKSTISHGPKLVWDDPLKVLDNTSIYGYPSDHFGAINPDHHLHSGSLTKDPKKIAEFSGGSNEVMVKNGLDLLGVHAPSRIICKDGAEKKKVLSVLKKKGVTQLGGKAIDQVVTV